MELALVLSTGFAVIACGGAVLAMVRAMKAEAGAEKAAQRLLVSQGTVAAHTKVIEALDDRLTRLNGRVNVAIHRKNQRDFIDEPSALTSPRGVVNGELDPDIAAELALQSTPPVRPAQ